MCVEAVFVVHVAETEFVQLGSIAAACGVDRKEDRPCYANAGKANKDGGPQESQV